MKKTNLHDNSKEKEILLGVVIQNNLKWSSQIELLCGKLKKRIAVLDRLRKILPKRNKKIIVEGLFNSVLCYCLPLFGGCSVADLDSLQVLQNSAARIVLNFPSRSNRDQMFNELLWLTVRQLVTYNTLVLIYRIRRSNEPEYLAQCFHHENINGNIVIKNIRLELYRNSFVFRGSLLWNKLPEDIKKEQSIRRFKEKTRSWTLGNVERFF